MRSKERPLLHKEPDQAFWLTFTKQEIIQLLKNAMHAFENYKPEGRTRSAYNH